MVRTGPQSHVLIRSGGPAGMSEGLKIRGEASCNVGAKNLGEGGGELKGTGQNLRRGGGRLPPAPLPPASDILTWIPKSNVRSSCFSYRLVCA